jgi:hypothetical protein
MVQKLKAAGIWDVSRRHPTWHEAFVAHEQATKNKLSESCGSCYERVRRWLTT